MEKLLIFHTPSEPRPITILHVPSLIIIVIVPLSVKYSEIVYTWVRIHNSTAPCGNKIVWTTRLIDTSCHIPFAGNRQHSHCTNHIAFRGEAPRHPAQWWRCWQHPNFRKGTKNKERWSHDFHGSVGSLHEPKNLPFPRKMTQKS